MIDHELRMCAYVQLACLSHQKQQALARDRFLLLAGAEACRAGWLEVADRCRTLLLTSSPHHQAAKFDNLATALHDAGFEKLVAQQERRCPAERAEHLLNELGLNPRGDEPDVARGDEPDVARGDRMLAMLAEMGIAAPGN